MAEAVVGRVAAGDRVEARAERLQATAERHFALGLGQWTWLCARRQGNAPKQDLPATMRTHNCTTAGRNSSQPGLKRGIYLIRTKFLTARRFILN